MMTYMTEIIDKRIDPNIESPLEILHNNVSCEGDYPGGMWDPGRGKNKPKKDLSKQKALPEKHNNRSEVNPTSSISKIPRETKIRAISPFQSKMKVKAGYAKKGKNKKGYYKGTKNLLNQRNKIILPNLVSQII